MKTLKIGFSIVIGLIILGFIFNQSLCNQFLTKVTYTVPKENTPLVSSIEANAQFEPRNVKDLIMQEDVMVEEVYVKVGDQIAPETPLFKVIKMNAKRQGDSQTLTLSDLYITVDENGVYRSSEAGIAIVLPRVGDVVSSGNQIASVGVGTNYEAMDLVLRVAAEQVDFLTEGERYTFLSEKMKSMKDFEEGVIFEVVKKSMIAENGMVELICRYANDYGTPLLYQSWHGTIEKTMDIIGVTVPKHIILTNNGGYMPGQDGKIFVIQTRKGILGDEDIIETIDVRIQAVGDNNCSVSGIEKDELGSWPRIVMNFGPEIKSGMRVFVIEQN